MTATVVTENLERVWKIAQVMHVPPAFVDQNYFDFCNVVASYFQIEQVNMPKVDTVAIMGYEDITIDTTKTNERHAEELSQAILNVTWNIRNGLFDLINRVNSFASRALNAGFMPPDNPFLLIAHDNLKRDYFEPITFDASDADVIISNINAYIELLDAEQEGLIDLEKRVFNAAQVSTANVSLLGYGSSGDTVTDLSKLLPDADSIKRQKIEESLAALDFRKRVPKVLFTADYSPSDKLLGSIVGWKRLVDASGYMIKRHDVFSGKDKVWHLSNEDVKANYSSVKDYVKTWVTSFYDDLDDKNVCVLVDRFLEKDSYFFYKVQAYQVQRNVNDSLFNVDTISLRTGGEKARTIYEDVYAMQPDDPFAAEKVSPYPFISQEIFGNTQYDWILAGLNVRASISRKDPIETTRQYSYTDSRLDFLFKRMDDDTFVIPKDMNVASVIKNINDALATYGVMQVIKDLLQETGVTYYFDGFEHDTDQTFRKVGTVDADDSGILSTVMAAIDTENMTLDLTSLATNLPSILNGTAYSTPQTLSAGTTANAAPTELEVPVDPNNSSDPLYAETDVQFINNIPQIDNRHIDLTTFEGISTLIRTIRVYSDLRPNRGAPLASRASEQLSAGKQTVIAAGSVSHATASDAPSSEVNTKTVSPGEEPPGALVGTTNDDPTVKGAESSSSGDPRGEAP
jgi:hypothetical protein